MGVGRGGDRHGDTVIEPQRSARGACPHSIPERRKPRLGSAQVRATVRGRLRRRKRLFSSRLIGAASPQTSLMPSAPLTRVAPWCRLLAAASLYSLARPPAARGAARTRRHTRRAARPRPSVHPPPSLTGPHPTPLPAPSVCLREKLLSSSRRREKGPV